MIRGIKAFLQVDDAYQAKMGVKNFVIFHGRASPEDKQKLEAMWREAGLGEFPKTND